jgi:hypothetical protein
LVFGDSIVPSALKRKTLGPDIQIGLKNVSRWKSRAWVCIEFIEGRVYLVGVRYAKPGAMKGKGCESFVEFIAEG